MWPPLACSSFYLSMTLDYVIWFAEVWAAWLQPEPMDLILYIAEVFHNAKPS